MLITSILGILANGVNLLILKYFFNDPNDEQKKENINIRAAIIHLLGDLIQAIGVLVAAIIIYCKPDWKIADPITTFVFALLVLITTIPTFMQCMRILMEFVPLEVDMIKIREMLNEFALVTDLHVWEISEDKICLTVNTESRTEDKSYMTSQIKQKLASEF